MHGSVIRFAMIALLLLSQTIKADTILGVYLSATSWQPEFDGNIESLGPSIDLNQNLGLEDDSSNQFSIRLEHPIPGLPNFGTQTNTLDTTAGVVLNQDISFDGTAFLQGTDLQSTIDLSHQDIILYYEVLDNWVSLDLGINLMLFDGDITLLSDNQSAFVELDEVIPSLYAMLQFEFPKTGMYIGAIASYIGLDDNHFTKTKLQLGWESDSGLGAELGYQSFAAEWTDYDNSNGNLNYDGYYASITYHF